MEVNLPKIEWSIEFSLVVTVPAEGFFFVLVAENKIVVFKMNFLNNYYQSVIS